MSVMQALYDEYHDCCAFSNFGVGTFQGHRAVAAYPDARRVLDFGCGNGYAVRRMRQEGHEWYGIELSRTAYEQHLREPYFFHGTTEQFPDRHFDMVYSTEVMEHIPESDVESVVADICRIARKYIFMTISLRPSSDNNRYHCTLRPRSWWEAQFVAHEFVVDRQVVDCYQKRTLKSTRQILEKWAHLGPIPKAFAQNPPYALQGETQFWFFAFRRRGCERPVGLHPEQPWHRRRLVPWLRLCLGIR